MNLLKNESKSRIQSCVLEFINNNCWKDLDDFSLRLTDHISKDSSQSKLSPETLLKTLKKIKTIFFVANKVSKPRFAALLYSDIGARLEEITVSDLSYIELPKIFPKIQSVTDKHAKRFIKMIEGDEKFLRDSLVEILRNQGATPIPLRGKDTAQEVADIELFRINLSGNFFKFAVVIKGFKSVKGKTLTWKDISHQVTRANQRGNPDYILLISAKEPSDGLITNLDEYSQSVGKPELMVLIPPLDLTKILLSYNYLKN